MFNDWHSEWPIPTGPICTIYAVRFREKLERLLAGEMFTVHEFLNAEFQSQPFRNFVL